MEQKPAPLLQTYVAVSDGDPKKHLENNDANSDKTCSKDQINSDSVDLNNSNSKSEHWKDKDTDRNVKDVEERDSECLDKENRDCDKRFLKCPAAVSMKHLQKFVRMKYGLTGDHRVSVMNDFISVFLYYPLFVFVFTAPH